MSQSSPTFPALPSAAGVLAALGAVTALFGTYWDDAWHTDKGRDEFFIAPHLTLYGGVLVSGLVVAGWMLAGWRGRRYSVAGTLASLRRAPAAALALLGAVVTVVSAPIDNIWHEWYGRDAVLWSPPHMLAVAGSATLAVGILAGVSRTERAGAVRPLLAAAALGSLLVPVLEFDSDVPQFPVATYWPVVTAGMVLFLLILRDLLPGSWTATRVAAVYMLVKLGIIAGLAVLNHSLTLLPLVVLVAVVDDVLLARGAGALVRSLTIALTVPLTWSLSVGVQPGVATQVPLDQVPSAVAASLAAAVAVVLISGHVSLPRPRPAASVAVLVVALATLSAAVEPRPAWAHDPGQGEFAGRVEFTVERSSQSITVTANVMPSGRNCSDLRPGDLVVRRAGEVRRAALDLAGCQATGTLPVSDGRWFVYVELLDPVDDRQAPATYESWVPVAADVARVRQTRDLYDARSQSPAASGAQVSSGIALYAIVVCLLAATMRLVRATGRRRSGDPDAAASAVGQPV